MCDLCSDSQLLRQFPLIHQYLRKYQGIRGCDDVCCDILDWTTKMDIEQIR